MLYCIVQARELAKELICGLTNTNTIGIIVDVVDVDGRHKVCAQSAFANLILCIL